MKVLDLFSGIGGFSLGLERAGMATAAFCETNEFCRQILAKHWPGIPCYTDIRTLTAQRLASDGITVDVVSGGFPCQPFSSASRGRRTAIDLWPEMFRLVSEIRPRFVIAENVQEAPIANAAKHFNGICYKTDYRRISASDCGADHQRSRWWVCAYTDKDRELHSSIHAETSKLPQICRGLWGPRNYAAAIRVLDGVPNRLDRIGALGNAVLPQIPEAYGRAIMNIDH